MNVFRGILESACVSMCLYVCVSVCVRNTSFCQSIGGGGGGGVYWVTFSDSSSFKCTVFVFLYDFPSPIIYTSTMLF